MNIHSQSSAGDFGGANPTLNPTSNTQGSEGQGHGLTADFLATLNCQQLDQLYRGGRIFDLARLDGSPRGRMLAIVRLDRAPNLGRIAGLAGASRFPWRGKSFQSHGDQVGRGINRVIALGDQFPFDTRVEASAIDGAPCVRLDYDKPENPFFIRAIRDELREVATDLFLGPAMLDGANPRLVLWFAIDHQGR